MFWPGASGLIEEYIPYNGAFKPWVTFIGQATSFRQKTIKKLRDNGVFVEAYGEGAELGVLERESYETVVGSYNLSVNMISNSERFTGIKLRDFEFLRYPSISVSFPCEYHSKCFYGNWPLTLNSDFFNNHLNRDFFERQETLRFQNFMLHTFENRVNQLFSEINR